MSPALPALPSEYTLPHNACSCSQAYAVTAVHHKLRWSVGCVTVLRETRAAQTTKLAGIRYMVICQLAFSLMFNFSYFTDGSRPSDCQVESLCLLETPICVATTHSNKGKSCCKAIQNWALSKQQWDQRLT